MGGTYPGKRVATGRRNRSGRAGNGDRLQAEGQVIDVRRGPHDARSRREAPRSLGSPWPLRAGESLDGRGFRHGGQRRRTWRSLCTLWTLWARAALCSLCSLGSGESDAAGALGALGALGSDWPWSADRSLGSGESVDAGSALSTERSLGSLGSGQSVDALSTLSTLSTD
jgi:hypothetical protein